ncbi:MAG: toast rack family protein [Gemmatimonadetes bacterium]|nr:toast rack family protein [Gemmatimonadota bacterium]
MRDVVTVATIAAATLLASAAAAQDWRTITSMRQHADEEVLRVEIQYGAGRLVLAPGSESALYKANLRYDAESVQPVVSYRGGLLRVGLDDLRVRGRNLRSGHLRLDLGTGVPIELKLEFGAARADLDLGQLRLRQVRIATGASETMLRVSEPNPEVCRLFELEVGAARFEATMLANLNAERMTVRGGVGEVVLDFTGEWRTDLVADVQMGLGSLTVRVPRGLGLRVRKGGILVGFDSQGLVKRGDVWYSEDWENAPRKLTLNIDAAFGTVNVAWVDAR